MARLTPASGAVSLPCQPSHEDAAGTVLDRDVASSSEGGLEGQVIVWGQDGTDKAAGVGMKAIFLPGRLGSRLAQ